MSRPEQYSLSISLPDRFIQLNPHPHSTFTQPRLPYISHRPPPRQPLFPRTDLTPRADCHIRGKDRGCRRGMSDGRGIRGESSQFMGLEMGEDGICITSTVLLTNSQAQNGRKSEARP